MSPPLSPSSRAAHGNRCPDCLLMKLAGKLVQSDKHGIFNLKPKLIPTEQIKLYLTIKFNEQEERLPGGCLKFGIKGGELKLKLDNGKLSPASSVMHGSFALFGLQETQNQEGSVPQNYVTVFLRETKSQVKGSVSTHTTARKIEQSQLPGAKVSAPDEGKHLTWVFAGENDNSILKGSLKPTLLGTLQVTAKPCLVEATFCVSPQDIQITDTTGLLPQTIGKKKRVVIERAIARRLLKRKMNPYLSRQELQYD